jgi:hypothetical protein
MTTDGNKPPPKAAFIVSLAVLGPCLAVQTFVCIFIVAFVNSDEPQNASIAGAILGLPILAWVVGVVLVRSLPRWRWQSFAGTAVVIAVLPWLLVPNRFAAHWPVQGSYPVDSPHCPKLGRWSGGLDQFPDHRNRTNYNAYTGSAGGIAPDFTPVAATRCLITPADQQTHTAGLTEQTADSGLVTLVAALRRPAEVWRGHCSVSFWAPTPSPNYLILTDANGHSFVVGLPTNGCGAPHPDAIAAFNALPWHTTNEITAS